jgi:L-ascorbate metabolism protein UlaG (beta-lactamase superfamily)
MKLRSLVALCASVLCALALADAPAADAAPAVAAAAPAAAPPARPRLTWIGHAAFELVSPAGIRIWIDPWLFENPAAGPDWKDLGKLAARKPDAILVTHAHIDHAASVATLARLTGAKIVAPIEHLRALLIAEAQQTNLNVGGELTLGDVTIAAVPAMHSAEPGGRPLGFILRLPGGQTLYHTGDTGVFGDMALIEELYHPTVLLLACGGGGAGMDPKLAAFALRKYFHPRLVIPMHFGTFPSLATASDVRATFGRDRRVKILTAGETIELSPVELPPSR